MSSLIFVITAYVISKYAFFSLASLSSKIKVILISINLFFRGLVLISIFNLYFWMHSFTLRACPPTHLHAAQFLRSAAYSQRNFQAAQCLLFLANRGGRQGRTRDPNEGAPRAQGGGPGRGSGRALLHTKSSALMRAPNREAGISIRSTIQRA